MIKGSFISKFAIEQYNNMDNKNTNKKRHSNNLAIMLTIIGFGVATTVGGVAYATYTINENLNVDEGHIKSIKSGEEVLINGNSNNPRIELRDTDSLFHLLIVAARDLKAGNDIDRFVSHRICAWTNGTVRHDDSGPVMLKNRREGPDGRLVARDDGDGSLQAARA